MGAFNFSFFLGIILLPASGIGLLIILYTIISVYSTELALTNQRIIAKTGFIRRSSVELRLSRVESVYVDQGIFGKMFNYGSVYIRGTGGTNTPIPRIKNPMEFRAIVNNHLDELYSAQENKPT
ncbi:MAG: hypothetical protein XXXJIFNMEKO3_02425 [Candidatus Erwinia impunctatus]